MQMDIESGSSSKLLNARAARFAKDSKHYLINHNMINIKNRDRYRICI